jgi:hypothetical protein
MKKHMEKVRGSLGDLAGLAGKTEAAERNIFKAATRRLDTVLAEIERAHTGIEAATDASQDRYLALLEERGQLQIVIAKARKELGI